MAEEIAKEQAETANRQEQVRDAAHDLLKSCEDLLRLALELNQDGTAAVARAEIAIAKAKGGAS